MGNKENMEVVDGQKVAHQGYGFLWKRLQGLGHSRLEHKKAAPFPKLLNKNVLS